MVLDKTDIIIGEPLLLKAYMEVHEETLDLYKVPARPVIPTDIVEYEESNGKTTVFLYIQDMQSGETCEEPYRIDMFKKIG